MFDAPDEPHPRFQFLPVRRRVIRFRAACGERQTAEWQKPFHRDDGIKSATTPDGKQHHLVASVWSEE
jgi:hypothetical protein